MLAINYSLIDEKIAQHPLPEKYLEEIPIKFKERIFKLKRPKDRYNRLSGLMLLKKAAIENAWDEDFLYSIEVDKNGRPFRPDGAFDFNISHADFCTVCALTDTGRIGIDIEYIRPIKIENFKSIFSTTEWIALNQAEDKMMHFYKIWTAKEAVAKADGRGVAFPFNKIYIKKGFAIMDNKKYNLARFTLNESYVGTIAHDAELGKIRIENADLWI